MSYLKLKIIPPIEIKSIESDIELFCGITLGVIDGSR